MMAFILATDFDFIAYMSKMAFFLEASFTPMAFLEYVIFCRKNLTRVNRFQGFSDWRSVSSGPIRKWSHTDLPTYPGQILESTEPFYIIVWEIVFQQYGGDILCQ